MKNIHILPTDKPSRLHFDIKLFLSTNYQLSKKINSIVEGRNIYITSDEEIKVGDWFLSLISEKPQIEKEDASFLDKDLYKKIILTTDQDLINVQTIDDEFLEWFVKNPSYEEVETFYSDKDLKGYWKGIEEYQIIIPKEEPFKHSFKVLTAEEVMEGRSSAYEFINFDKQETLEEAVELYFRKKQPKNKTLYKAAKFGAKWQSERMYSEQEVFNLIMDFHMENRPEYKINPICISSWFNKVKKK